MGQNRTPDRCKANQERRIERRIQVVENNARLSAECQARHDAVRDAYRKAHPGEHKVTFSFRGNPLITLDFSGPPVDFDPKDPEKGVVERTREMNAAFDKARQEPSN